MQADREKESGVARTAADSDREARVLPKSLHRERIALLVSLLAFALLYAGIASYLNRQHALWSPDAGARLLMIRNAQEHGNLIYLHYNNADVDPEGQFHPVGCVTKDHLENSYLLHLPKGFCTVYPPLFPFLSSFGYRLFGFDGLTLLPLLAGVATLAVTYALAGRLGLRSRLPIVLAMGAATPLLIYSVVFWDHTLHFLLAAAAGYLLLRALQTGKIGYSLGAGATLGAGVFIHELLAALFLGMLVGSVVVLREKSGRRAVGGLFLGFALLLPLWGLVNWRIYGIARGPHVIIAGLLTQSPDYQNLVSVSMTVKRLLSQVIGYDPAWGWRTFAVAGVLLVAYGVCLWRGGRALQAASLLLLLLAALTLGWLVSLARQRDWALGMFEVAPLLLPALAFPTFGRLKMEEPDAARLFYRWMGVACLVFGGIVFTNPHAPELNWGSRYLLTALPLWTVLAARALEGSYIAASGVGKTGVVASVVALVGVGLYANSRGIVAVHGQMADMSAHNAHILAIASPAIVLDRDSWITGMGMVEEPKARRFLVSDFSKQGEAFFHALDRLGIREFVYVGTPENLKPLQEAAARHDRPFVVTGILQEPAMGVRFAQRRRER